MNTTNIGQRAERAVSDYLKGQGYTIVAQNWKTKYCEIDIVARKGGRVVFVEVKYRTNDRQGSGLDYITSQKQRQMAFAAEMWVQEQSWDGEYCLGAVEVSGEQFEVGELILLD